MKLNLGIIDRIARILAAVLIAILYFTNQTSGIASVILLVFAGILVATSLVGFCPLYLPFHISTRKKKA